MAGSLEEALGVHYKFIINNDLRTIEVPAGMVFGVYNDRNVQTIDFEMPRYYHGDLDLSEFAIRINYITGGEGDIYLVEDKVASSNKITFTWTVDIGAYLQNGGSVTFSVCLRKVNQSDEVTHEFNTTIYTVKVLEGLEVEPAEPAVVHDYLTQIQQIIENLESTAQQMAQDIADEVIASIPQDYTALSNEVSDLNDDLKVYEYPSENLYDKKLAQDKKIVDGSSINALNLLNNSAYIFSGITPVENGKTYTVNQTAQYIYNVFFLTSEGVPVCGGKVGLNTGVSVSAYGSWPTPGDKVTFSRPSTATTKTLTFTINDPSIAGFAWDMSGISGWDNHTESDFNSLRNGAMIVEGSSAPSEYIPHTPLINSDWVKGFPELNKNVEDIQEVITENGGFSYITGTKTAGHWIDKNNTDNENSAWNYYTYAVTAEDYLSITTKAGINARAAMFYNANDEVIGRSQEQDTVAVRTEYITVPANAVKMIVNTNDTFNDPIVKNLFDAVSTDKVFRGNESLTNILSNIENQHGKMYGKILCCCGDSITYGEDMDQDGFTDESNIDVYQSNNNGVFSQVTSNFRKTWGWQIASRNQMTFYNAGVSGSTMQAIPENYGFSIANGRYTKLPENIDYLVIWFGWNDNAYGTLGEITDDTNESYYGGYNVVLPYLQNKYPYAKIALVVPFGASAEHREAIRELGDIWGIAVWDNYQGGTPLYYGKEENVGVLSSVVTANRAKFQANGAHPNYKGHTQLADMIEEFLLGI